MFTKNASSMRWRCAVGVFGLLLVLQVGSPARGDGPTVSAQTHAQRAPLPRPGTYRLIRIGPQALLKEDDRGRMTMVDELEHKVSRLEAVGVVTIGVLTAGAVLMLHRIELNGDVSVGAGPP
jgi:hypothetical protein